MRHNILLSEGLTVNLDHLESFVKAVKENNNIVLTERISDDMIVLTELVTK